MIAEINKQQLNQNMTDPHRLSLNKSVDQFNCSALVETTTPNSTLCNSYFKLMEN